MAIPTDRTSGTRTRSTQMLTYKCVEIFTTPLTTAPRQLPGSRKIGRKHELSYSKYFLKVYNKKNKETYRKLLKELLKKLNICIIYGIIRNIMNRICLFIYYKIRKGEVASIITRQYYFFWCWCYLHQFSSKWYCETEWNLERFISKISIRTSHPKKYSWW